MGVLGGLGGYRETYGGIGVSGGPRGVSKRVGGGELRDFWVFWGLGGYKETWGGVLGGTWGS